MKIQEHVDQLKQKYQVLDVVPLSLEEHSSYSNMKTWLEQTCQRLHRTAYGPNQRLVFTLDQDTYVKREKLGLMLRNLQVTCAEVGINNFFIIVVSTNPNLQQELDLAQNFSTDIHAITGVVADDNDWQPKIVNRYPSDVKEDYKYGAINPIKISLSDLSNKEKDLLTTNKTFCMYPWIHINANPDGQAYPCCMTDHKFPIGNVKQQSLAEIWNNSHMREVRRKMLAGEEITGCERCYEQERAGFFSGRLGANRHHGHHVGRILETKPDGTLDRFEMVYWDIRFSNLCNLRCRSCGHIYSSQWYQDQVKLAGPEWAKNNKVLNIAGQHDNDMWEQLLPHIDYVEQIYFAGGEPLLMHEHYRILEELVRREMFNVRLIYNTNFTHTHLKDRSVFEYWKLFDNVSVGASLDGAEQYAEVIRKGSNWDQIERNRVEMLCICPQVDFYVSATLSIMNAFHLTEFHRNWVERGYILHQDFNINILQDPNHYRIDIAPPAYKQLLKDRFEQQIEWLKPHDKLRRATQGYQSAINFMMSTDNQHLIPKFWQMTKQLDGIRNENLVDLIPELENLNANTTR